MSEPEELPFQSIDGVDYRIEVVNSEAFMEPGHDRILQSTWIGGFMLYFTVRSVYRVPLPEPPEVGSAPDAPEAERADGPRRSEAP